MFKKFVDQWYVFKVSVQWLMLFNNRYTFLCRLKKKLICYKITVFNYICRHQSPILWSQMSIFLCCFKNKLICYKITVLNYICRHQSLILWSHMFVYWTYWHFQPQKSTTDFYTWNTVPLLPNYTFLIVTGCENKYKSCIFQKK